MRPSFFIATFGCKVNQYETQQMREQLLRAGLDATAGNSAPDFAIINTCTVTSTADAKARRFIGRVARRWPGCRIIVTGCMVNRDPDSLALIPGVWRLAANEDKASIVDVIRATHHDKHIRPSTPPITAPWGCPISDFAGHSRAFVKVQDGCDAGCAYCVVPSVRGTPRSRPIGDVLEEVAQLAERFSEIVLTGIHLGLYRDESGADLAALARRVLEIPAVQRLRLSSIESSEVTPELLDVAGCSPRFCPHFHIPLQSGSDTVLRRMNRRYSAAEFLEVVNGIRSRLDRPALTADVMVGFPGETDGEFNHTLEVCHAAAFSRIHVFRYCDRPGTAAAAMRDKCRTALATQREQAVLQLATELALEYRKRFVGDTVGVLVETRRDRSGRLCGYTDRYVRVLFDGPDSLAGRIVPVVVTEAGRDALLGRLERKSLDPPTTQMV